MAKYRQIQTSYWQDPFVLDLTPEEKYFYLYLLTNSKTTQCGIYELPKKIIEMETGYNRETVDKLLQRFVDYGKILYSDSTREIFVVNWIKYNFINSATVVSHIQKELQAVKNKDFANRFHSIYSQANAAPNAEIASKKPKEKADTVSIRYPDAADTVSIPYPASQIDKPIPYPETRDAVSAQQHDAVHMAGIGWGGNKNRIEENRTRTEENRKESPSATSGDIADAKTDNRGAVVTDGHVFVREQSHMPFATKAFAEFWSLYPKKVGKKTAELAWKKINPDAVLHAQILAALKTARTTDQWLREGGRYIPNPATWLNQSRWEDEYNLDREGRELASASFVPSTGFRTRFS